MPADDEIVIASKIRIDTTPQRRRIYINDERFVYATDGLITVEEYRGGAAGKVYTNVVWIPVVANEVEWIGTHRVNIVQGNVEFVDNGTS